jgi:Protein of unknown function, DUF488
MSGAERHPCGRAPSVQRGPKRCELQQQKEDPLAQHARRGSLTLLHDAHDHQHNNAVVLAEVLDELTGRPAR